jgi:hypothetical protein
VCASVLASCAPINTVWSLRQPAPAPRLGVQPLYRDLLVSSSWFVKSQYGGCFAVLDTLQKVDHRVNALCEQQCR